MAFTLGEMIGFGLIPVLGGVVAMTLTSSLAPGPRSVILYGVAVVGGFGEGAVLATFQVRVFQYALGDLDPRGYVPLTGLAASLAWAVGMLPSTLDDLVGLATSVQVAIWALASVVILASIGVAQAWALRRSVPRAWRWVVANAVGWLAGLPWTFLLPMAVPDDAPAWVFGIALFIGGVLMGTTTGAVTGLWFTTMVREARASRDAGG